jgi:endogenous inhibitor of DNA gyrase (YacG/DUF329 family)
MIQCFCNHCQKPYARPRNRGKMDFCSPCQSNIRVNKWKRENKDRARKHAGYGGSTESKIKYAKSERGMEISRVKARRFYSKNIAILRARSRAHYAENRDAEISRVVNRRMRTITPAWANLDAISAIYAESRRRTRETGIKHEVDHFYPVISPLVCGLHVETNLRVITAFENKSKSNKLPTVGKI